MLVDDMNRLVGIFTDSDLVRLLEQRRDADLDKNISDLMTTTFSAIKTGSRLTDAIDTMVRRRISELPVVDGDDKPVGLIDITDVLGLEHEAANESRQHPMAQVNADFMDDAEPLEWRDAPSTLRLFGADTQREDE
jgi:arabinose-5-phosphate isomerase